MSQLCKVLNAADTVAMPAAERKRGKTDDDDDDDDDDRSRNHVTLNTLWPQTKIDLITVLFS